MTHNHAPPIDVLVLALPETAGSALYGLVDVLMAAGNLWHTLTHGTEARQAFRVRIVSPEPTPFACGNGIPVRPDAAIGDDPVAPIVIVPELWLGPDEAIGGRHPQVVQWLRRRYRAGATLYSACSGAAMLAETGLLDGYCATSHWGYRELFRKHYPKVRFDPAPNLVFARADGRIVTAGGTTSWHDLALHIIGRHASPGEALRIAKVYLMKWHSEGQLPYAPLLVQQPHGDSVVRRCEAWLREHWLDADAVARAAAATGIAERTLERRFKAATGCSLLEYLQNFRIEEAKRQLEKGSTPIDEISEACGYGDASFFRRLFKRLTGLTPGQYRRMFSGLPGSSRPPADGAAGNTLRHSK
jgi:transcriptional regulator GlxA family with amidase domain